MICDIIDNRFSSEYPGYCRKLTYNVSSGEDKSQVILYYGFPIYTSDVSDEVKNSVHIFYIESDVKGKGFGKFVISEFEKWVKDMGHERTSLQPTNIKLQKYYMKIGYVIKDVWGALMVKNL